jgi:hypothetical protein
MENTFWHNSTGNGNFVQLFSSGNGNFVKLFKKSFKLYVESGTRKKMEAAINILINEPGPSRITVTEDFIAKFYTIITEHYLRKIHILFIST